MPLPSSSTARELRSAQGHDPARLGILHGVVEHGRLFMLKWGRVRIYKTDRRGGEFTLEVLGEGTVFGELSLVGLEALERAAEVG